MTPCQYCNDGTPSVRKCGNCQLHVCARHTSRMCEAGF